MANPPAGHGAGGIGSSILTRERTTSRANEREGAAEKCDLANTEAPNTARPLDASKQDGLGAIYKTSTSSLIEQNRRRMKVTTHKSKNNSPTRTQPSFLGGRRGERLRMHLLPTRQPHPSREEHGAPGQPHTLPVHLLWSLSPPLSGSLATSSGSAAASLGPSTSSMASSETEGGKNVND